jgi:hypothetical protein
LYHKNQTRTARTRFRQEFKKKRIMPEFQGKKSHKNSKKKKNQARSQEYKILAWRGNSCLASQDSVYMDLARKSRSVFSDKNLV